jgi:uncharacterized repeat protein (TIGR01451 family)
MRASMTRRLPPLLVSLPVWILVGSCVGTETPTGVDGRIWSIDIPISASLIPSPADAGALPINRIRARAASVPDGAALGEVAVDVSPTDSQWEVLIDATVGGGNGSVDVVVYVLLINATGGVESVQFSGLVGPLTLTAGSTSDIPDVPIVRGPIDNLYVTGVSITAAPDTLLQGAAAVVRANALTSGTAPPSVFWTVLDSALLSSSDSTVTALAPGIGRIVASAGSFADTTSIVVTPAADLVVSKSASVSMAQEGDTVDFEIVVTNGGPGVVAGAVVTDSLPAELIFASATPAGAFDQATSMWSWTLGSLATAGADTIAVRATVGTGTSGSSPVNTSWVAVPAGVTDPDTTNDRSTATIAVTNSAATVDVAVLKSVDDPQPPEGGRVVFTVRVVNSGADTATDIVVVDTIPAAFTNPGHVVSVGSLDGDSLWTIPSLAAGDTATWTSDHLVAGGVGGSSVTNTALLRSVTETDATTANDTSSVGVTFTLPQLDIAVLKTVDNPQPLADSTVVFTVSVVNNGPGTATGIAVFDTLASAPFTSPAHTVSMGALVGDSLWTIPSLAAGDTATWSTTTVVATGATGGTASNTAILRSLDQVDSLSANDSAVVAMTFPLSAVPVVQISSPADGSVFDPGDTITFLGAANDAEDGSLTPAIEWASDVDGVLGTGRIVTTSTLSTGVHRISASVTDSDGGIGADSLTVTIALIAIPPTLNVPFGGTASLPITLTEPAPPGGVTLSVSSDAPTITTPGSPSVFIAQGALSANATLSGLLPGSANVTVSNPQFGSAVTVASVTAELDILGGNVSFPESFTDQITIQLESQGVPIAAPAGGMSVTLTSSSPACVTATSPVTIPGGQINTTGTLSYGGSATPTCQAYVYAVASGVVTDSVPVSVTAMPTITLNARTIGAGLQESSSGSLNATAHGGVTLTLTSSNPQTMLVSPNAGTAGAASIDLMIADGVASYTFYVQGVEGATGTATLTASAQGFNAGLDTMTVVQPGIALAALISPTTTQAADDDFYAQVGYPNGNGVVAQQVRAGGSPVTVTFDVDDTQVGLLTDGTTSGASVNATIPVGLYYTPPTVGSGGVAHDPQGVGTATITASAQGFTTQPSGVQAVVVTAPTITVNSRIVGSGLQESNNGSLNATGHGGVTVTLTSSNSQVLLLSPNDSTPGTSSINVAVPAGQAGYSFYVQGVEGATGTPTVTATALGFTAGTDTIDVVQPGIMVAGLATTITTLSPDNAFYAQVGRPSGNSVLVQEIRAGGSPVTVTFRTDNTQTGVLTDSTASGASVTATIPVGLYYTPTTVATGGVAYVPLNAGSANVSASASGFVAQPLASQAVTVTAPTITVGTRTVASGLQQSNNGALNATAHGGVTLTLTSSDPQVLLLSPNDTTAGTASINVPVPDGQSGYSFYVQGVEGATGTPTITATAQGFIDGSNTINVVQAAIAIAGLGTTTTTLTPDDEFFARVGYPNGSVVTAQQVRAGGSPITATFTTDDTGVGLLTSGQTTGRSVTAVIPVGALNSPTTVATGGVAHDPQGPGTATITATAPGIISHPTASVAVTVSAPAITLIARTVGSGLQVSSSGSLNATGHLGVTLTLTSSDPQTLLLSPNASTAGASSINIDIAAGTQAFTFYVQGVEGATGTATVTAAAQGFINGSNTVTVVQPAIALTALPTSLSAAAADDAFYAYVGIPNGAGVSAQVIRAGGTSVTVTATTSNTGAAQLVTQTASGASVTAVIPVELYLTPAAFGSGGFALDPVAAGQTVVGVSATGFVTTPAASLTVTINP